MPLNIEMQEEEIKKKLLIEALIAGEESGFDKNFGPKKFLEELHSKLK